MPLDRYILGSRLEAFFPAIAVLALFLGLSFSPLLFKARGANHVWIVGLIFLLVGVKEVYSGWNPALSHNKTAWQEVYAQFFGRTSDCTGSECLYELFSTMPFVMSVFYSLGAFIRKLVKLPSD